MALSTRALSPAIALNGNDGSYFLEKVDSVEGRQYMAVKKGSSDNQVKPLESGDTAATTIVGFLQADADNGESVCVRLEGTTWARAQGSVTRGDVLEAIYNATEDKNGNLQTLATLAASGKMIAAEALEGAADGEYFKIRILKQVKLADAA